IRRFRCTRRCTFLRQRIVTHDNTMMPSVRDEEIVIIDTDGTGVKQRERVVLRTMDKPRTVAGRSRGLLCCDGSGRGGEMTITCCVVEVSDTGDECATEHVRRRGGGGTR